MVCQRHWCQRRQRHDLAGFGEIEQPVIVSGLHAEQGWIGFALRSTGQARRQVLLEFPEADLLAMRASGSERGDLAEQFFRLTGFTR